MLAIGLVHLDALELDHVGLLSMNAAERLAAEERLPLVMVPVRMSPSGSVQVRVIMATPAARVEKIAVLYETGSHTGVLSFTF